ncbi:MAG: hypothetical protein N4A38_04190 [Candidatus Gracilibacteria bacterium]|nr:hypothetical protein [Candidatus Gracilibacteria bacterium]
MLANNGLNNIRNLQDNPIPSPFLVPKEIPGKINDIIGLSNNLHSIEDIINNLDFSGKTSVEDICNHIVALVRSSNESNTKFILKAFQNIGMEISEGRMLEKNTRTYWQTGLELGENKLKKERKEYDDNYNITL